MARTVSAFFRAFVGASAAHYPIESGGRINPPDVINRINDGLRDELVVTKDALDCVKASLAEVKAQTEYQDAKASRLLTIIAFLSALTGVLFGKYIDSYPILGAVYETGYDRAMVCAVYVLFFAFILLVAAGALLTFFATLTRYVWVADRNGPMSSAVKSRLFFKSIVETKPEAWGQAFSLRAAQKHQDAGTVTQANVAQPELGGDAQMRANSVAPLNGVSSGAGPALGDESTSRKVRKPVVPPVPTPTNSDSSIDLLTQYYKDYVIETYLVSAKVADKVRYLDPAQRLLLHAIRVLFAFVLLLAATYAFVGKTSASSQAPTIASPR